MVPSEYQEISEHLKRVLDDVELASCHFVPFDGNLCNRDPELFSEQEKLNVEYPRCKVLSGKYVLCSASRKELEPALGITNMSNADDTKDGMKSVHEDVSKERTLFEKKNVDVSNKAQPDIRASHT